MDEDTVIEKTLNYLKHDGWDIIESHSGHEHGIDIKAKHSGRRRYYYIEAKGDPSNRKSRRAQLENNFTNALGQIVTRIKSEKAPYYGIALPESYEKLLEKVSPNARKRLNLWFLIVKRDGTVKEIRPPQ